MWTQPKTIYVITSHVYHVMTAMTYTRKNLTYCIVTSLSTSCLCTACHKLSTSLEQAVNNLNNLVDIISLVTRLWQSIGLVFQRSYRFDSNRGQASFSSLPVWIYTQSNITNIIFTWVQNTNTEKKSSPTQSWYSSTVTTFCRQQWRNAQ